MWFTNVVEGPCVIEEPREISIKHSISRPESGPVVNCGNGGGTLGNVMRTSRPSPGHGVAHGDVGLGGGEPEVETSDWDRVRKCVGEYQGKEYQRSHR